MGKIYAQQIHDESQKLNERPEGFISFYEFIELVRLHTKDSLETIIYFLYDDETIFSLNHYLFNYGKPLQYRFDDSEFNETTYPVGMFLEDVETLEHVKNKHVWNEYFFKISDILDIPSVVSLGIDIAILTKYLRILRARPEEISLEKVAELDEKSLIMIENAQIKINEQQQIINELKEQLKQAQVSQPSNDKELAPNSQTSVTKILYALLAAHNYELTPEGKGKANEAILNASNQYGASVSKNTVAKWLKRVYQLSIDTTKTK